MKTNIGDLVACYLTNSENYESLLEWGIVLDTNPSLGDILVLSNRGASRWWPERRWRIIQSKKNNKIVDLDIKPV